MMRRRVLVAAEPFPAWAALALPLLAGLGSGCRSIWLGGKQDVEVVAPRGTKLFLDGIPVSPGPLRLRRNRDYTLSTDGGWCRTFRSRLAWEFFLWFLVADGPFELLDFVDGSAYYIDPRRIEVPAGPERLGTLPSATRSRPSSPRPREPERVTPGEGDPASFGEAAFPQGPEGVGPGGAFPESRDARRKPP